MLLPLHQNNLLESGASATKTYSVTFTRHALYAGARPIYGSFTGKVAAAPEVATTEVAAGKRTRYRRRYFVEIDGQTFEVGSYEEAQELLRRARELAELKAEVEISQPPTVQPGEPIIIDMPYVDASEALQPLVEEFRADVQNIYEKAAAEQQARIDAEIRAAIRDDDEAVSVLLM